MSAEPASRAPTRLLSEDEDLAPEVEAPFDGPPGEQPEAPGRRPPRRRVIQLGALVVALVAAGIGYAVWQGSKTVEIDESTITAPQVPLTARAGGTLKQVYASVGDDVKAHRPIARVGNEVITSDVPGVVVSVRDDLGAFIPPGSTVGWLMDWHSLRAVGKLEEDDGLADLQLGQRAEVEVDAFGGRRFPGTVEEISQRPARQDIRFNISDKREERQYDVKVRFDGVPDAALRQGMSARIWVQK